MFVELQGEGVECLILNSFPHAIQSRGLGLAIKKAWQEGALNTLYACLMVAGSEHGSAPVNFRDFSVYFR